jgi:hypothetical protein
MRQSVGLTLKVDQPLQLDSKTPKNTRLGLVDGSDGHTHRFGNVGWVLAIDRRSPADSPGFLFKLVPDKFDRSADYQGRFIGDAAAVGQFRLGGNLGQPSLCVRATQRERSPPRSAKKITDLVLGDGSQPALKCVTLAIATEMVDRDEDRPKDVLYDIHRLIGLQV